MHVAVYLPPQVKAGKACPVLCWLSGLTCTDENFIQKASAQRTASELGIILVAPDTSPRGEGVPDDSAYDLGQGAGFYVNATEPPFNRHYHMYDYVTLELPQIIAGHFKVSDKQAIAGHSMGGHGALTIALKNPGLFTSVSAFSPICHPSVTPWGEKAFAAYLGNDRQIWEDHDATCLIPKAVQHVPMRIDQGLADEFLHRELQPDALKKVCTAHHYPLTLNYHAGYDHSYYFIASFMESHLRFHHDFLK